jgi:hypothetical protein
MISATTTSVPIDLTGDRRLVGPGASTLRVILDLNEDQLARRTFEVTHSFRYEADSRINGIESPR